MPQFLAVIAQFVFKRLVLFIVWAPIQLIHGLYPESLFECSSRGNTLEAFQSLLYIFSREVSDLP